MSTDWTDPSLKYTLPSQLTPTIHRRVPDELQPQNVENREAAEDKVVVITGGGTGIGAAIARIWVRAGAKGVIISGRRQEALDETLLSLETLVTTGTQISALCADVTKEEDAVKLFDHVHRTLGRSADIVFANAGLMPDNKTVGQESIQTWWRTFEVNVLGVHTTTAAWIRSQPDPMKPAGTIININTGLSCMTVTETSAYTISKLAAQKYMEFIATEYPTLRPFSLIPGIVSSDMSELGPFAMYAKDEAEQAGAMSLYLASPRADYLRGSLISVNWDLQEMLAREEDIKSGLLKLKCSGLPGAECKLT